MAKYQKSVYHISVFERSLGVHSSSETIDQKSIEWFIREAKSSIDIVEIELKPSEESRFSKQCIDGKINFDAIKSDAEISKLMSHSAFVDILIKMSDFLCNYEKIFKNLEKLEEIFKNEMAYHKEFNDESRKYNPKYLISSNTIYQPGPPPDGYKPLSKGHITSKILLAELQRFGLNKAGIASFVGLVDPEIADDFIAKNHTLFKEDDAIANLLIHGKYTHIFQLLALFYAVESGELKLEYESDGVLKKIDPKQFLEILIKTKVDKLNVWNKFIDSILRAVEFDHNKFSFETSNPFIMNSLMICFGEELGIPTINRCLLDNYYKKLYIMLDKFKEIYPGIEDKFPDENILRCVIISLSTATSYIQGVQELRFTEFAKDRRGRVGGVSNIGYKEKLYGNEDISADFYKNLEEAIITEKNDVKFLKTKPEDPPSEFASPQGYIKYKKSVEESRKK